MTVRDEFGGTAFGPPKQFSDMELLFPSADDYRRLETWAVGFGAATLLAALALGALLLFQSRLQADQVRHLDPWVAAVVFAVAVAALRAAAIKALVPSRVFYDASGKRLAFYTKTAFGSRAVFVDGASVSHVELKSAQKSGDFSPFGWTLAVAGKDGSRFETGVIRDRLMARQGALKISRALGCETIFTGADGRETERRAADAPEEPLIRRLENPPKPAFDAKAHIQYQRSGNTLAYNVSLSPAVTAGFVLFGGASGAVAFLIWMASPPEVAGWLILFIAVNASVVFFLGGAIRQIKRPLAVSSAGVTWRDTTIPLARIGEIAVSGRLMARLRISSDTETIGILATRRQAEWLKRDLEHELWSRRSQTPKKTNP